MPRLKAAQALREGTPGAEFDPRVAPRADEPVVTKHGISAFAGTPLAATLQVRGVDTLLLCGLVTHFAVEGTGRDAHDRGYRVVVLEDCCTSGSLDRHAAALANLRPLAVGARSCLTA